MRAEAPDQASHEAHGAQAGAHGGVAHHVAAGEEGPLLLAEALGHEGSPLRRPVFVVARRGVLLMRAAGVGARVRLRGVGAAGVLVEAPIVQALEAVEALQRASVLASRGTPCTSNRCTAQH
jgi:hypothetical protein